ncbi:hypothetical protein TELCIR_14357, partial [Teladorsagia circumcincta]
MGLICNCQMTMDHAAQQYNRHQPLGGASRVAEVSALYRSRFGFSSGYKTTQANQRTAMPVPDRHCSIMHVEQRHFIRNEKLAMKKKNKGEKDVDNLGVNVDAHDEWNTGRAVGRRPVPVETRRFMTVEEAEAGPNQLRFKLVRIGRISFSHDSAVRL